jgi:hypothetical protein
MQDIATTDEKNLSQNANRTQVTEKQPVDSREQDVSIADNTLRYTQATVLQRESEEQLES